METLTQSLIEWAVATRALQGQTVSGDRWLALPIPSGFLAAVVDGLGEIAGRPERNPAAVAGVATLADHAGESVVHLMQRCHENLRQTRGAAISIAFFHAEERSMSWLGVGNVEGVLVRADPLVNPRCESLLLRGGVVGAWLPPLHRSVLHVARDDTLILVTDGIRRGFAPALAPGGAAQRIADQTLEHYSKNGDDALVLVARYRGIAP